MGQDRKFRLGKKELTPHEMISLVLRSLRADASKALGVEVTDTVITVPAYFNDHARQATGVLVKNRNAFESIERYLDGCVIHGCSANCIRRNASSLMGPWTHMKRQ